MAMAGTAFPEPRPVPWYDGFAHFYVAKEGFEIQARTLPIVGDMRVDFELVRR
jgi:hypothetical protein